MFLSFVLNFFCCWLFSTFVTSLAKVYSHFEFSLILIFQKNLVSIVVTIFGFVSFLTGWFIEFFFHNLIHWVSLHLIFFEFLSFYHKLSFITNWVFIKISVFITICVLQHDTWHMTHDTWHLTHSVGLTFSKNFSSLALPVWDWQCIEDIWTKSSVNQWINELWAFL